MNEREMLRHIYDEKYQYVLKCFLTEIERQKTVIEQQNKIINSLENRLKQVEKAAKITTEIVAPQLEEISDERSLNTVLKDFAENKS